jgi:hypothetical protein
VMPNIDILLQKFPSDLLQAIVESNKLKKTEIGDQRSASGPEGPTPRREVRGQMTEDG